MIGSPATGLSRGGASLPVKLERLFNLVVVGVRRSGSADTRLVANRPATANFRARRFTMIFQRRGEEKGRDISG